MSSSELNVPPAATSSRPSGETRVALDAPDLVEVDVAPLLTRGEVDQQDPPFAVAGESRLRVQDRAVVDDLVAEASADQGSNRHVVRRNAGPSDRDHGRPIGAEPATAWTELERWLANDDLTAA